MVFRVYWKNQVLPNLKYEKAMRTTSKIMSGVLQKGQWGEPR